MVENCLCISSVAGEPLARGQPLLGLPPTDSIPGVVSSEQLCSDATAYEQRIMDATIFQTNRTIIVESVCRGFTLRSINAFMFDEAALAPLWGPISVHRVILVADLVYAISTTTTTEFEVVGLSKLTGDVVLSHVGDFPAGNQHFFSTAAVDNRVLYVTIYTTFDLKPAQLRLVRLSFDDEFSQWNSDAIAPHPSILELLDDTPAFFRYPSPTLSHTNATVYVATGLSVAIWSIRPAATLSSSPDWLLPVNASTTPAVDDETGVVYFTTGRTIVAKSFDSARDLLV